MHVADKNTRPQFDPELQAIADYVIDKPISNDEAYRTARLCLMDSMGCALLALNFSECKKLLGPIVPGVQVQNAARVPGTAYECDPVQAAFNFGALIRWLDYNDTWLAAEWGHPSDNLAAILMVADYVNRQVDKQLTMRDVLSALIKAYEIQGVLALENSFNRVGLDHVLLVKVASTAVVANMLGANRQQVLNAISQAWLDGQSLRTYRHAPNTGSRKSWAAGDAGSRAVRLSLLSLQGECGYPSVLSAKKWGFCDVYFDGRPLSIRREFDSYVMNNILFKVSFPAEFHAQTAVEAAMMLHPQVIGKIDDISAIAIQTHESAMRIINKTGPLYNPADRDHCLQYMVAVGLLKGSLTAEDYEDDVAADSRLDALRDKMQVSEDAQFSKDYLDPEKRSIANTLQIRFKDGTQTEPVSIEYPLGHRKRRDESIPILYDKFKSNAQTRFTDARVTQLMSLFS